MSFPNNFLLPFSLLILFIPLISTDMRMGFYDTKCPQAESIVQEVVEKRFRVDPSIPAALLRMHFHDCFVRGCDASILIDATESNPSEKSAPPNLTVRGFDIIDDTKQALEEACPSTVSCADIITIATRDAVVLAGGPYYDVPTGRRDGLVSNPNDVNLPGPSMSVQEAFEAGFSEKGFTLTEMITLTGAHTVGFAHCSSFQDRLSPPDPSMDPALLVKLRRTCANATSAAKDNKAFLDQSTTFVFDNQFYNQILGKKGVLFIDQQLALDHFSVGIVTDYASDGRLFSTEFAVAMVKMGNLEVLTGEEGEIRTNCRFFN